MPYKKNNTEYAKLTEVCARAWEIYNTDNKKKKTSLQIYTKKFYAYMMAA